MSASDLPVLLLLLLLEYPRAMFNSGKPLFRMRRSNRESGMLLLCLFLSSKLNIPIVCALAFAYCSYLLFHIYSFFLFIHFSPFLN